MFAEKWRAEGEVTLTDRGGTAAEEESEEKEELEFDEDSGEENKSDEKGEREDVCVTVTELEDVVESTEV
jgi:hypothetical protein